MDTWDLDNTVYRKGPMALKCCGYFREVEYGI